MSERKTEKKEREWSDEIPDPEEGKNTYEETYRDDSAQLECWNQGSVLSRRSSGINRNA